MKNNRLIIILNEGDSCINGEKLSFRTKSVSKVEKLCLRIHYACFKVAFHKNADGDVLKIKRDKHTIKYALASAADLVRVGL